MEDDIDETRAHNVQIKFIELFPKESIAVINEKLCAALKKEKLDTNDYILHFGGIMDKTVYNVLAEVNPEFAKYFNEMEWYESDWFLSHVGNALGFNGYITEVEPSEYAKNSVLYFGKDGEMYDGAGNKIERKKK